MRKFLILAATLAMASCGAIGVVRSEETEPAFPQLHEGVKRRKNKTANKIRTFMGYASDRKGKGQKKRDASARRSKGWM